MTFRKNDVIFKKHFRDVTVMTSLILNHFSQKFSRHNSHAQFGVSIIFGLEVRSEDIFTQPLCKMLIG